MHRGGQGYGGQRRHASRGVDMVEPHLMVEPLAVPQTGHLVASQVDVRGRAGGYQHLVGIAYCNTVNHNMSIPRSRMNANDLI